MALTGLFITDTDDWRHRAACRDENPELFFPVGKSGPAAAQAEAAKAVCVRCPVRTECLEHALRVGVDGVWGATTEDERRDISAKWRARRRGVSA